MEPSPGWWPRGPQSTAPALLVRLHRHDLFNVLIQGGTAEQRLNVALAFHRESELGLGPFVCVDCVRDQHRLLWALHSRLSAMVAVPCGDPLSAAENGTLFLDHVAGLGRHTQKVLLALSRRSMGAPSAPGGESWVGRLIVGNAEPLAVAVASGAFLPALDDVLDKVRIELPVTLARGAA